MRHLFIINPVAARLKGQAKYAYLEVEAFFREMGMDNYDIHVTRFVRDAFGYVSRYVRKSQEPVRVHTMGGSGTVYEVINAIVGLPNAQIAVYPMGNSNYAVRYFGKEREHMFKSLRNQVFSDVIPIDAMKYGDTFAIAFALLGLEARVKRDATRIQQYTNMPTDVNIFGAAVLSAFRQKNIAQNYNITIDEKNYGGEYLSILIAGMPCYGINLAPAPEAHPNDGLMDIYLVKKMSAAQMLYFMKAYVRGNHAKLGTLISHVRGEKISISSERGIVISIDGELINENNFSFEVIPGAIDFVCPGGIDVDALPRLYGRPNRSAGGKK